MHRSYKSDPHLIRRQSRAVNAASAAVIIILLLLAVTIVELVILAFLNAKLRAADPSTTDETISAESTLSSVSDTTASPQNITDPGYNSAYLSLTEDFGRDYIDKIIFVGDSTTYHLISNAVLTDGRDTKQVWVPIFEVDGSNLPTLSLDINIAQVQITHPKTGVKMTIAEAAATEKPEYMVITLGINNGVPSLSEDKFKQCYRKLLDAVKAASPDTKIILQSIFPVTKAYSDKVSSITNEKIDRANIWVADLALEYKFKYLNTNPILKDENGYLNKSYENGDGLHLNKSGYEAVLYYMRTHGYPNN